MKRTMALVLTGLLLATGAWAKDSSKQAKMVVAIPGMDAAKVETAVATIQSVDGVIRVSPDMKTNQLKMLIEKDNAKDTRKAVRKALKKAVIAFEKVEDNKGKKDDKKEKSDKKPR